MLHCLDMGTGEEKWRIDEVEITPMSSRLEPDAKLNDIYKVRDVAIGTTNR